MYIVKLNPKILFLFILKKFLLWPVFFWIFFCTANWTLPMYDFQKPSRDQNLPNKRTFVLQKLRVLCEQKLFSKKYRTSDTMTQNQRRPRSYYVGVCIFSSKRMLLYVGSNLVSTQYQYFNSQCLIRHNYLHHTPDLLRRYFVGKFPVVFIRPR